MRAEIAVLGGGIIGAALAEELARRKHRVVLIERGRIGTESSAAAAGILLAQMDLPRPGRLFDFCQAARRMYGPWVRRLERTTGIRTGYRAGGVWYLAATRAQEARMAARARWQIRQGLPVRRCSRAEVRRLEPAADGAFRCGFLFSREGEVDNVALMRALEEACGNARVTVREQTTVERLLITQGRVRGVVTDHGTIKASIVVNTLGSWARLDGRFPVRVPVEPARGQILSFLAPKRLFRHPIMTDHGYLIQRTDGHVLLGSTVERVGFDKSLTVEGMHTILGGVRKISSALARCRFVDAWAGLRPYSATGEPLLGGTSVEGLYLATGHFRHGILLAPATATLLANWIELGRPLSTDPLRVLAAAPSAA